MNKSGNIQVKAEFEFWAENDAELSILFIFIIIYL